MDFCQAEEYIQCKLADTLMYKDEVISYLKQLSGRDENDKLNSLFIEDMINVKKNVPKDKSGNIMHTARSWMLPAVPQKIVLMYKRCVKTCANYVITMT